MTKEFKLIEERKEYQIKLRKNFNDAVKEWRNNECEFDCVEEIFEEAVNSIGDIDKEFIMMIPEDAIGGRGGDFIKVIEIKEIDKISGDLG